MIHQSAPWKAHLIRDAHLIERWAAKPNHSERRSFLIERTVFLAAYAMRKLDEDIKLSTDLLSADMPVLRFPPPQPAFLRVIKYRLFNQLELRNPHLVPNEVPKMGPNSLFYSTFFGADPVA
ncbi:MAG TPA: hypothetical protein VGO06_00860 [Bosea sp. (in: a-proteobacteria)]|jgi:hypothetical protein|nr:hypothetical protein [Bosea sp. (in: a-proteobacteria)]